MIDRLAQFIANHGLKHWQFAAKKDQEFVDWVHGSTSDMEGEPSFAVRTYCAISDTRPICSRSGRVRTLNSIEKGWRFCGRAAVCQCASESISDNLKRSHSSKSEEDRKTIAAKGATTLMQRYGVANAGQTAQALDAHKRFYSDSDAVSKAVEKGRQTMMSKYGVDNALKLEKVNETRKKLASTLSLEVKAHAASLRKMHSDAGGLLNISHSKLVDKFKALGIKFVTSVEDYRGVSDQIYYLFRCLRCDIEFDDYIDNGHNPTCPKCDVKAPYYRSKQEVAVADFIKNDLGLDVILNSKKIFGTEIDIFVPEKALAIEYCGLYWHSELGGNKKRQYHLDKLNACMEQGVRLITIFADEWENKKEVVESRLRAILGCRTKHIGARQTKLREIDPSVSRAFMEYHHIQGHANGATIHIGLFLQDDLVSVMTFGKLRKVVAATPIPNHWEMYRFASTISVVGGASKIFKYFLKNYHPVKVVSYCDLRWGTGNVYRNIGFREVSRSAPGYWWMFRYASRQHRYSFTKASLVRLGADPALTEVEIMREKGYDRIWDCGNIKFEWTRG